MTLTMTLQQEQQPQFENNLLGSGLRVVLPPAGGSKPDKFGQDSFTSL